MNRKACIVGALWLVAFLACGFCTQRVAAGKSYRRAAFYGQAPATSWKLAVVFKRDGSQCVYTGTVDNPDVPSGLLQTMPPPRPSNHPSKLAVDYEIWLAADGSTYGIGYSSARHSCCMLTAYGEAGQEVADDGKVRHLIDDARPAVPEPPGRCDAKAIGEYMTAPASLADLCHSSRVIVVGRVAGVLRAAHSPVNSQNLEQHTVYVIAVESYLMADASGSARIVKFWQTGGSLPWRDSASKGEGVGFGFDENPRVTVGNRYILFLTLPVNFSTFRALGYVGARIAGVRGKIAELDEYYAAHHWRGKLLLRDGMTYTPTQMGAVAYDNWSFASGPQIVNVPEHRAIAAIRAEVARQANEQR